MSRPGPRSGSAGSRLTVTRQPASDNDREEPHPMPEPPSPTRSTAFVVAETRAAAHFLRGIAAHVLAIAEVLPLPSQEVQDLLRSSGSEQLFAEHPAFDTYTDLQLLAREEIPDLADRLELAADKCDREAGPGGV